MDASLIHGFATEIGSSVSHTAILARSMGIPAVVGLDQALLRVESHSPAILDGYKGVLILKPTKETEEYYHRLQVEKEKAYKALEALRDLPTTPGTDATSACPSTWSSPMNIPASRRWERKG